MANLVFAVALLAVAIFGSIAAQSSGDRQCQSVADCPAFCKAPVRCEDGACKACNLDGMTYDEYVQYCPAPVYGKSDAACGPYDYITPRDTVFSIKCNGIHTCGYIPDGALIQ